MIDKKTPMDTVMGDMKFFSMAKDMTTYGDTYKKRELIYYSPSWMQNTKSPKVPKRNMELRSSMRNSCPSLHLSGDLLLDSGKAG